LDESGRVYRRLLFRLFSSAVRRGLSAAGVELDRSGGKEFAG